MKIKVKIRNGQKERRLATSKSSVFPDKITKSGINKQTNEEGEEEQ